MYGMMKTLHSATTYYSTYNTAKIIKQKLASVSLLCKTTAFKQQISKLYPQILSIEDSFYIYERPLTEKM